MPSQSQPPHWQTPWQNALQIDGLFESSNGISGRQILAQNICDELTDILKLDRIPSHLIPQVHIDSEFGCSYRSFWATKGGFCDKFQAPSIFIEKDYPLRALVEEVSHFIFDYYQSRKSSDPTDTLPPGHQFQSIRAIPIYDESLNRFVTQEHVTEKFQNPNARQILNDVFLTYQEALAHTLTQLYFKNKIEKEPALTAAGLQIGNAFAVMISDSSLPIAHISHQDLIYIPQFPENIIEQIKDRGIIDVLAECEYELRQLAKSAEDYYSQLPSQTGRPLLMDFVKAIPHLKGLVTHGFGYTIGDRCADRICKNPESLSEFLKLATNPSYSFSEALEDLITFSEAS
jgi:hypothetical protein